MSIRKVNFISGEYYHLYNRGNSKQKIFHDKADYYHFLKLLYLSNSSKSFTFRDLGKDEYGFKRGSSFVAVGAYCLMPNHFHLLVTEIENDGISKFMQKLTTAYSMYHNKKYARSGTLFEGKFKSEHANNDRYLKYLFSYIHLNPVKIVEPTWREKALKNKQRIMDYLNTYPFSSYQDYMSQDRPEKIILNKESFPSYFLSTEDWQNEMFEWISFGPLTP